MAHIRWMIRRDMPRVMEIEQASFWDAMSQEAFLATMRRPKVIGMVAEFKDEVLGYMLYELHADRIELLRMAVDPKVRRDTIGSAMLFKLVMKLRFRDRRVLVVRVPDANLGCHLFLRANGLRAVEVEREFYPDGSDAYVFEYRAVRVAKECVS